MSNAILNRNINCHYILLCISSLINTKIIYIKLITIIHIIYYSYAYAYAYMNI